jgi:hypothetical protein
MAINIKRLALPLLLLLMLLILSGCPSKDVEQMKAGLVKSGMPEAQAELFAEQMSKTVEAGPYNYMAKLMNAGVDEKTAVNRTRRKYGAEFLAPMKKARAECVK